MTRLTCKILLAENEDKVYVPNRAVLCSLKRGKASLKARISLIVMNDQGTK